MFELSVDGHFDSAHFLRGYPGDCARLHGHSWKVTVAVSAAGTGNLGMAVDFKTISTHLNAVLGEFDHRTLNDLAPFADINPTAENIARFIFERISLSLNAEGIAVSSVTVAESERCRVVWKP